MASHAYAATDAREQIIPIHMNMVRTVPYWQVRAVNWFAWGGVSGTEAFLTTSDGPGWFLDVTSPDPNAVPLPEYAGDRRPLTPFVSNPAVFHDPVDVGYPLDWYVDDVPLANANRQCWTTLGNSYRANLRCYLLGSPISGAFSTGPWGHRLSKLRNTSRMVLYADPLFYNQLSTDQPSDPVAYGWHNRYCRENVAFVDGSARTTSSVGKVFDLTRRPLGPDDVGVYWPPVEPTSPLLAGATWQSDCYPAPGAVIFGNWTAFIQGRPWWPWQGAQLNPGLAMPGQRPSEGPPPVQSLTRMD